MEIFILSYLQQFVIWYIFENLTSLFYFYLIKETLNINLYNLVNSDKYKIALMFKLIVYHLVCFIIKPQITIQITIKSFNTLKYYKKVKII